MGLGSEENYMAKVKISIELNYRDLVVLSNSLNEVCNGLPLVDFENRVGIPREEALRLLGRVHQILDQYDGKTEIEKPPH